MCKIQVSVTVSDNAERERAILKLGKFPGRHQPQYANGVVTTIVEHPKDMSVLQAASWAKDVFGLDATLCPAAQVLA